MIGLPPDCNVTDRIGEVGLDIGAPGAEVEKHSKQQKRGARGPCLGRDAVGKATGTDVSGRGKPAKTSGSRCSKYGAAASIADAIVPAASWCPYLASPAAISELACGQTVPVW